MSVDEKTVQKVAHLARIRIAADEVKPLATELSGILHWIEQLTQVDISDIEPMTSVNREKTPMREDKVEHKTTVQEILGNAPEARENFFIVPKVVE